MPKVTLHLGLAEKDAKRLSIASFVSIFFNHNIMFDFDQYLGFIAFLTILTIGFWLMIFLVSIIPYWIGGALIENMKLKREAKNKTDK